MCLAASRKLDSGHAFLYRCDRVYNGRIGPRLSRTPIQPSLFKIMVMSRKSYLVVICLVLLLGAGFYFYNNSKTVQFSPTSRVDVKPNSVDAQKNDVFLVDETGKSQLLMTVGFLKTRVPQGEFAFWPLLEADGNIWIRSQFYLQVTSFLVLNPDEGTYHQYDVEADNISFCDLALNDARKEIAYGSFCPLETDDVARAIAQGLKTSLYVYNLETKLKQTITTGVAKQYKPVWLNDEMLEYDNPNGVGRISSKIAP